MSELELDATQKPLGLQLALALAAFAYPLLVFSLLLPWGLFGDAPPQLSTPARIMHVLFAGAGMGAVIGTGFFGAMLVAGFPIAWAMMAVQKSIELDWSGPRRAAHIGAWAAFLGTTLLGFWIPSEVYDIYFGRGWTLPMLLCLGPGLATPLLQYSGAWSQWPSHGVVPAGRWRFGIRQVLVTTAWVAVVLTAMKLFGLLSREFVTYFLGWLVYQYATMELVLRFCGWRAQRLLNRRGGDGGG